MPRPAAMRGGAGAARAMSGQVAFDRAEASARESEVKTLSSANKAADERLASTPPAATGGATAATRRVAGRVFVERDGVWTDMSYVTGGSVVGRGSVQSGVFRAGARTPGAGPLAGCRRAG